jgi:hypothetical protein
MNLPSPSAEETQLGHDLRELAIGESFTPDLAVIRQRARQRRRRGLALRGTAVAGVAALAAGGVFVGVHGAGGAGGTGGTSGGTAVAGKSASTRVGAAASRPGIADATAGTPAVITVAYVTGRVKTALGNVNQYIVQDDQVQTGPGGDSDLILTDPRTSNAYEVLRDSSGESLAWLSTYLVNRVLTWKDIEADYSTHTWFVDVFHAAGPIQGSTAGATSTVMTPAEIKGLLDSGRLTIIGHKVIDGHQTIGLRQPWARGYRELWVDSTTFLPVRLITADFADQKGPLRSDILIDNESWLPRTQALVNEVNQVHIPAGFTQVAPPQ